jgi:hypothetical protein
MVIWTVLDLCSLILMRASLRDRQKIKFLDSESSPAGCRFGVLPWADSRIQPARHYRHYLEGVLLVMLCDCMRHMSTVTRRRSLVRLRT